jgi:hypothetical protein
VFSVVYQYKELLHEDSEVVFLLQYEFTLLVGYGSYVPVLVLRASLPRTCKRACNLKRLARPIELKSLVEKEKKRERKYT